MADVLVNSTELTTEKRRIINRLFLYLQLFLHAAILISIFVCCTHMVKVYFCGSELSYFQVCRAGFFGWPELVGFFLALVVIIYAKKKILKLSNVFLAIMNLPVYWLSCFSQKDDNLWIFSCRQGSAYAENSKYLFEHVLKFHKEVSPVWITKNKRVYAHLESQGLPCVMAYSVKGYLVSIRAGCLFVSNFRRAKSDYNDYAVSRKTLKIQLWHGSPLKKIGKVRPYHDEKMLSSVYRKIFKKVFPFYEMRTSCHRMLASSNIVADQFVKAFDIPVENIWVDGYPKNDGWLSRNRLSENENKKKVIYMPTWRSGDFFEDAKLFSEYEFDLARLDIFCEKNDFEFFFKVHPFVLKKIEFLDSLLSDLKNVHLLKVDDVYQCLDQFDILVTDYSSILFDFLLSGKPVIYSVFDYESYSERDGFLFDYSELKVGHYAYNWSEIEKCLLAEHDSFNEKRQQLCEKFNSYQGCESSCRVVLRVRELLAAPDHEKKLVGHA